MDRLDPKVNHAWHVAINRHCTNHKNYKPWMYEAKKMADEIPRIAHWFARERLGELPEIHRQCSHSSAVPIQDNHLTCCLGVECRKCPALLALDQADLSPEQIDAAKAWTCAAHILSSGSGIDTSEGYIKTVGDQMFWENVYSSLAGI